MTFHHGCHTSIHQTNFLSKCGMLSFIEKAMNLFMNAMTRSEMTKLHVHVLRWGTNDGPSRSMTCVHRSSSNYWVWHWNRRSPALWFDAEHRILATSVTTPFLAKLSEASDWLLPELVSDSVLCLFWTLDGVASGAVADQRRLRHLFVAIHIANVTLSLNSRVFITIHYK
jgi:hypothetical protein